MIHLEEIRVDPLAPEFTKPHPKQESIWSQQYVQPLNKADLVAYPNIGTEKLAEYARRGSMKAVCYNLQKAADSGLLEDKNTLKGM